MKRKMERSFGIFVVLFAAALFTGCSSLENKAVVVDSSVQGFKVTTGADASGGTPMPNISAGWGRSLLLTMPTDSAGTLEYESESGSLFGEVFGIEVKDSTKVRITAQDSRVVITTSTDAGKTVETDVGGGIVSVNVSDAIPVIDTSTKEEVKK
ncbi:MAG: hypothetical protein PHI85_04875 [Victivallaceae bacterium]|nr:hypothetical protein [Victivallaceae bacterium]